MILKCRRLEYSKKYSIGNNHDNIIIHGNNVDVIDEIKKLYKKSIKCIYIDPPYNNGDKYHHYDDKLDNDIWLNGMEVIIKKLKELLTLDGSLWISIDDNQVHYLKVLCDKIFGRNNFVTTIIWQQRTTRENRKVFSNNHEYILVYTINPSSFKKSRNLLAANAEILKRYKNPDNDIRGPWQSVTANVQAGHAVSSQFYEIIAPNGKIHNPPKGRCWIYNKERMQKEIKNNNIWFGNDGNGVPRIKKFLSDSQKGVTPETLWLANEVGTNKTAKKHLLTMFPNNKVFDTPKPEELIKRIFDIATDEGDLILDAFLGSGTTAAVAHKMNRSYIGIERGNQIYDYIYQRLKMVINGEQGGISPMINWNGGGGFDFYEYY
ncbi:site-specific DNA-methyltransferase [Clostridium tyrobutyricum]|uniref:site-specific DNA-methyltransferase n=1 Tax=Clostridium tyrobutyricum TaxID=1519 RepID=UPI001C3880EA|nr:site-specific DNA-methyltransferase [Clostridium tyrobutyricum]MBV4427341.1 site-specific DNA-methyltransferase [Clostridium tyrobutyricum]MBV4442324.1 site-specific DNA-methyltransferase [Clostridium tyrobutyricum]